MTDHSPRFVVVVTKCTLQDAEMNRFRVDQKTVAAGSHEACLAALRLWPGGTIAVERKKP